MKQLVSSDEFSIYGSDWESVDSGNFALFVTQLANMLWDVNAGYLTTTKCLKVNGNENQGFYIVLRDYGRYYRFLDVRSKIGSVSEIASEFSRKGE